MAGKKCCSLCCQIVTFAVLAVLFIGIGVGAIFFFDKLIRDSVNDQVALKNGTQSMDEWKEPTSPVYMSYYVFDCQNPEEVSNNKKPNLTQRGPYTYVEKRVNVPVSWADNGNTLTYKETKWYYFDKERSCPNCSDSDTVMVINISPLALANATVNSGVLINLALNAAFDVLNTKLMMNRTVHEVLFGYTDEFLAAAEKLEHIIPKRIRELLHLAELNPRITLQYNGSAGTNNTGTLSIVTGKDDPSHVMDTLRWKNKTSADFWRTKYGGMLNGTDGTHFHPFVKKSDVLYTFITDLCRSLHVDYQDSITVQDIDLLRFVTTESLFANVSINPDNAAFCVPRCFTSGILPIGQCLPNNPPIMMSAPHFYLGDPELVSNITGMDPQESIHATYIDVEPYTGITMQAYKRLQINLYVQRNEHLTLTENVRTMVYPILFLQEYAQVSSSDASKFRSMVYDKVTLTRGIQYGLIAIGCLFVIIVVVVAVRGRSKSKDEGKVGLISGDQ